MGHYKKQSLIKSSFFSLFQSEDKTSTDSNDDVLLEPVHSDSYYLGYTCLLIPRLPSRQLKGAPTECLSQWLQQICASYNWRKEFITINPDYFQWGLRVPPTTQPSQFMQEIRQRTSELILSTFEVIRNENSTNDFWAPGYLVVLGTNPHPKEMIERYIHLLRRS